MEIQYNTQKACLYEPPTYAQWFDSHQYEWIHKNRTFRGRPSKEFTDAYQKAVVKHLKWQGKLIKTFMRNCNGHKGNQ